MARQRTLGEQIGRIARHKRLELGLLQADVARRAGLDGPALAKMERGRTHNPSVGKVARLAKALGVRLADLMPS